MGLFGRDVHTSGKHERTLKKVMDTEIDPETNKPFLDMSDPQSWPPGYKAKGGIAVEASKPVLATRGDPSDIKKLLEDPTDHTALDSFLPKHLQCLDKFAPNLHFSKPQDMNEILGLAQNAPTAAQDMRVNLKSMTMDGPGGLHALAFVGGCLVIFGSCLNVLRNLFVLSPMRLYFSCVMVVFGFVIVILEQQRTFFPKRFRMMIGQYFLFLTVISGRGLFYVYVGTIQAAVAWKRSTLNVIIGIYMVLVGCMYIYVGRSIEKKLNQLQHSLHSPTAIRHAFEKYDADRNGYLDEDEFGKLISVLGTTLTVSEALIAIDMNRDGKISLEELEQWCERPEQP